MTQKRIQELQSITARLGQLDVSKLSESQLAERNTLIKNIKEELTNIKKQGVAEGVAETLPMPDAVKLLRQYGADHFKTTSNELHFYKNGRGLSVDLVMNPDATRSVTLSSLNSATRALKGQGVAEGIDDSPVASAITRRIMMQRVDLLSKYGPEKVMNAIDEVADFVGDVDEIGSSDVSGWIRHVEQMLGNMPGVTTEAYDRLKKVFDFSDFKG